MIVAAIFFPIGLGLGFSFIMVAFASAYIIALAGVFLFRFVGGRWKTMRVIESA